MTKSTGLGDNFYLGGYNLSGDVGSLGTIGGGNAPLEVTGIDKSGYERLGGQRTGTIEFTAYHNDAALAEYPALSTLLTSSRQAMYFRGTVLGNAAAACIGKQVNYDWTRGADGSLTKAIQVQSDGYGLEWGLQLSAGIATVVAVGNGTGIDTTASLSFGAQAYLQVFSFSGTDVTIKVQDSADDVTYADVTGLTFTSITGGVPLTERLATTSTATIRRYLRYRVVTSTSFTSVGFALMINKNAIASQVF
jgi:hypothetical protein